MRKTFEQGDIIFDKSTMCFGIVINDLDCINRVKALEVSHACRIECPHKSDVEYVGEVGDLRAEIKRLIKSSNLIKGGDLI